MVGIADILGSVVRPGTGTDPNTGSVLRDRFHQIRGNETVVNSPNALNRLAVEMVQSRGAPLTQKNVQMAADYLRGGALGMFEQQQSTEDSIADAAMAAEGANAPRGTSVAPPASASPPMARQDTSTATAPISDDVLTGGVDATGGGSGGSSGDGIGGLPFVAPAAVVAADQATRPRTDVALSDVIEGEIIGDDGRVVGVNADASNRLPNDAPVASLPPTPKQIGAPRYPGDQIAQTSEQFNPAPPPSARTAKAAPQLPNADTDASTRAIASEEVVPKASTGNPRRSPNSAKNVTTSDTLPEGARKVGMTTVNGKALPIYKDGSGFAAQMPDGKVVRSQTRAGLRSALRGVR